MKPYHTRITRLTVLPKGDPIFSEFATDISIEDEAGGEFIEITQHADSEEPQKIRVDFEEWPHIRAAVNRLVKDIARPSVNSL